MNFPTILTLARIILTAPLMIFIFVDNLPARVATIICFVVASLTDFIDGRLARKNHQVTDLGAFLDPLADKMLVNLTLLALVVKGLVPLWIFAVILIRDFAVDGVRMQAAKNGTTIAASLSGKLKTTVQMVTITLILLNTIFENHVVNIINLVLLYIVVILTIVSGLEIIIKGFTKPPKSPKTRS